jgi:hypothetical protein
MAAPSDRAGDLVYIFWHFLCPCPRHTDIDRHGRRSTPTDSMESVDS